MKLRLIVVILLSVFILMACGSPEVTVTEMAQSIVPTNISPSSTPVPSSTIEPTPTLEPTEEPTATVAPPEILIDYLINPMVDSAYTLSRSNAWRWDNELASFVSGGKLRLNSTDSWQAYAINKEPIGENQAYLVRFSYDKSANLLLSLSYEEFGTAPHRTIGIHAGDHVIMSNYKGAQWLGEIGMIGNLRVSYDHEYIALLAVSEGGEFLAVIWDAEDTTHSARFSHEYGEDWAGLDWNFRVGSKFADIYIHSLEVISFEGFTD